MIVATIALDRGQSHLKVLEIYGGSEPHVQIFFCALPKVAFYPADQNSIKKKMGFTAAFLK